MAWVIGGLVVVLAVLFGLGLQRRSGLSGLNKRLIGIVERGELRIDPVPPELVPPACVGAVQALEALGFTAYGAVATRPGNLPVMFSVLLLSGDAQTYARVSAMGDHIGPPTVGMSSYLEGHMLDTSTVDETVADPTRFSQLLPGRPPDQLVAQHQERLRALEADGLVARRLTPEVLPDRVRQSWIDEVMGLQAYGLTRRSS